MSFKFLPHTADTKIIAEGVSLEKAFVESAMALKEVIADKIKIKSKTTKEIRVEGKDRESLLLEFLQEFLYFVDAENFVLSKIEKLEIKKAKTKLSLYAKITGDKASNYNFTNEVKAVTYNEMLIKEEKNKTTIQFVLDV